MTHKQHIAEIREALELIPRCSAHRVREAIASLDTLAAECLRLREDGERFISALDLVEYREDGKIVWEHFRAVIDDFKIIQALDAAKEAK